MQKKHKLEAKIRKVIGRKVKSLRKSGIIPANIYGKKVKSQAIEINAKEFDKIYKEAGETGLVELKVDDKERPVLIKKIQTDTVSQSVIHVDFHQVDLKEKVHADVPITFINEPPAVKANIGTLLHLLSNLQVEALPSDLPDKIEIDISILDAVDKSIKVSDIKISDKVKIINESESEIIKVAPLVSKEAESLAKEEEEKKAADEAVKEGTEGEVKTEKETVPSAADQNQTSEQKKSE